MSEIGVSNYGIFSNAIESTNKYITTVGEVSDSVTECQTTLSDQSIFMGPIQENCMEEFQTLTQSLETISMDFTSVSSYFIEVNQSYNNGDQNAANVVLGKTTSTVSSDKTPVSSVTIPTNINQSGYTVTCYGTGGWYLGGSSTATSIARGTNQEAVHNVWLSDGARYKNGIAVINVDGVDHYLVATTSKLGNVGDSINVTLDNGQTVPCVVADAKSSGDSNYTAYGHSYGNSVNVLEFEVDRNIYNSTGNPTTKSWGLEWDSSSDVRVVDNFGTIL